MADMEDAFQEILGNEQAMNQIMSIANSLSGNQSTETSVLPPAPQLMNMGDMLQGLDPKYLAMGMRLVQAYQTQHRSIQLLSALQPFVGDERQEMMQRLTQATKFAKVATSVWAIWKEQGNSEEGSIHV